MKIATRRLSSIKLEMRVHGLRLSELGIIKKGVIPMRIERIGHATLYLADCRDVLPTLGMVDVVITDPPYEEQAHTSMRRTQSSIRDGTNASLGFDQITEELRRNICDFVSIRCRTWFLAFCQVEGVYPWSKAIKEAGSKYFRAMAWIKPDSSPQFNGQGPAQGYESIVTAWCGKGRSCWNGGGKRGVFIHNTNGSSRHGVHPTEKPLPLMNEIMTLFSNRCDTIFDPFMGSASTGVSALKLGRKFIGIEKDPKYFDISCQRIQKEWDSRSLLRLAEHKQEQGILI